MSPKKIGIDDVLAYALDCSLGFIMSCTKHKWACERFIEDYNAARNGESAYKYDWHHVGQIIEWASYFEHTKGVLAKKPIELHISQVFVVANIYGFYVRETGHRRFTKAYFQVARKNAKSQLLTVITTYELMVYLNGGMSEVYCAATKRDQAKIVYAEVHNVLKRSKELRGKWKEAYNTITHLNTGSTLKTLSKEDGQKGDGLNPQCGCIDEYHAHQTSEILDVVDSGMGARPDPLLFIITTAGHDLSYPCYQIEYRMAAQILDPDNSADLPHVFADVHELETNNTSEDVVLTGGRKIEPGGLIDNPFDPEIWPKANPIICSYPEGVAYLQKKAAESEVAPEKKRGFYTKHLNVWVNLRDAGYMPLKRWSSCKADFPVLRGRSCWVGLDLSSKIDLTSASLVFPIEIGGTKFYVVVNGAFMPEATFFRHEKTDKNAFYSLWKEKGWLIVTPGSVIHRHTVIKWVLDKVALFGAVIEEWCVDPWGATLLSSDLIAEGHTVVDIIQGPKTLSEPTKEFRDEVYDKHIIHDGNPLLTWAIGNAVVVKADRNENIIVSKEKSVNRVDPLVATLNAFTRASIGETEGSAYNNDTDNIRSFG